jgi:hypothetical protein
MTVNRSLTCGLKVPENDLLEDAADMIRSLLVGRSSRQVYDHEKLRQQLGMKKKVV